MEAASSYKGDSPPRRESENRESRPIFGSLAKIVAEELSQHTLLTLEEGLHNMPSSETLHPMIQYIKDRHMEAVDLFEIFNNRSIFNPHFITDSHQRATVEEIYHNAIDAQSIREAIRQQQEHRWKETEDYSAMEESLPDSLPSDDDLERLKVKIEQLSLRKLELENKRNQLHSSKIKLISCDTLLQNMEKSTESATASIDVDHIRKILQQAQAATSLGEKAKDYQKDLDSRKRKGDVLIPKQRKKRASFGTRYKQCVAGVDTGALAAIVSKIQNNGE